MSDNIDNGESGLQLGPCERQEGARKVELGLNPPGGQILGYIIDGEDLWAGSTDSSIAIAHSSSSASSTAGEKMYQCRHIPVTGPRKDVRYQDTKVLLVP